MDKSTDIVRFEIPEDINREQQILLNIIAVLRPVYNEMITAI